MSEPSIDAVRRDHAGWIFVHIEGEPYDRGEQHGQLLANEIRNAIHTARYLAKWDTGEDFDTFVNAAVSQFAPKLDTEYADEIQGIADGAKLPFAEVLAWNGYMDLLQSWWPTHASQQQPRLGLKPWRGRRGHHCSADIPHGRAARDRAIGELANSVDRAAAADDVSDE